MPFWSVLGGLGIEFPRSCSKIFSFLMYSLVAEPERGKFKSVLYTLLNIAAPKLRTRDRTTEHAQNTICTNIRLCISILMPRGGICEAN